MESSTPFNSLDRWGRPVVLSPCQVEEDSSWPSGTTLPVIKPDPTYQSQEQCSRCALISTPSGKFVCFDGIFIDMLRSIVDGQAGAEELHRLRVAWELLASVP